MDGLPTMASKFAPCTVSRRRRRRRLIFYYYNATHWFAIMLYVIGYFSQPMF
jgi:hypothetical protein